MSKRTCLGVSWFVVGGLAGAAASFLYAPYSGHKTRHLLRRQVHHGREYLSLACDDISQKGRHVLERSKMLLDHAA